MSWTCKVYPLCSELGRSQGLESAWPRFSPAPFYLCEYFLSLRFSFFINNDRQRHLSCMCVVVRIQTDAPHQMLLEDQNKEDAKIPLVSASGSGLVGDWGLTSRRRDSCILSPLKELLNNKMLVCLYFPIPLPCLQFQELPLGLEIRISSELQWTTLRPLLEECRIFVYIASPTFLSSNDLNLFTHNKRIRLPISFSITSLSKLWGASLLGAVSCRWERR